MTDKIPAAYLLAFAVVAAVNDCPEGVPGGSLYAALMTKGCSLSQFQQLMGALTNTGLLHKAGELYTATDKGRAFAGVKVAA